MRRKKLHQERELRPVDDALRHTPVAGNMHQPWRCAMDNVGICQMRERGLPPLSGGAGLTLPVQWVTPSPARGHKRLPVDGPGCDEYGYMVTKMYVLASLMWDYTETVRNIASQMKIKETRRASEAVRQIHLDYDRFRCGMLDDNHCRSEEDLAVLFESICRDPLSRLYGALKNHKSLAGLDADHIMLVEAVHAAMTVLAAVKMCARDIDKWLRDHGIGGNSVYHSHFRGLEILLPQFAGDAYDPGIDACRITASVLYYELRDLEMTHDDSLPAVI